MGFTLSYKDIIWEPIMFSSPIDGIKGFDTRFYLKIGVKNTGNSIFAQGTMHEAYKYIFNNDIELASITLRIKDHMIDHRIKSNDVKIKLIDEIIGKLKKGIMSIDPSQDSFSMTNLPCFDINFRALLRALGEPDKNISDNQILYEKIKERTIDILSFFGFDQQIKSILNLKNESVSVYERLADSMLREEPEKLDIMEKSLIFRDEAFVSFFHIEGEAKLIKSSRLITKSLQQKLRKCLPAFISQEPWRLLYSSFEHGTSLQTYF